MSTEPPTNSGSPPSDEHQDDQPPVDPRDQMKAALEAKRAAHHMNAAAAEGRGKASGPQTQHSGKRQFRRKAGG